MIYLIILTLESVKIIYNATFIIVYQIFNRVLKLCFHYYDNVIKKIQLQKLFKAHIYKIIETLTNITKYVSFYYPFSKCC